MKQERRGNTAKNSPDTGPLVEAAREPQLRHPNNKYRIHDHVG